MFSYHWFFWPDHHLWLFHFDCNGRPEFLETYTIYTVKRVYDRSIIKHEICIDIRYHAIEIITVIFLWSFETYLNVLMSRMAYPPPGPGYGYPAGGVSYVTHM